jgi:putative transposase
VDVDKCAVELSRYIHLNPVRAGMVAKPEEHQWSSYKSYIGQSKAPDWQKTNFILGYFGGNTPEDAKLKAKKLANVSE